MSDYAQNNPQQKPKTIMNHNALSMYAPNGEGKFANASVDFKKNNVNVVIRTNVANDANNNYGRIAEMVPMDKYMTFLRMLEEAAMSTDNNFRWCYEHRDRKFIGQGKMTDGPVLIYRLVVGKEENGVVYWSMVQEKRPNIKFSFLSDTKTSFKDGDGNEMPKGLESKFLTLGKVDAIRLAINAQADKQYKHPEPKQPNGGNGNWNRGGQGGGNGGSNNGNNGNNGNFNRGGSAGGGGNSNMGEEEIPW